MSVTETIKALADESRLRIIGLLAQNELNVQELTGVLDLSQSTASHHLKVLQTSGIISLRREGTRSYYTLNNGAVSSAPGNIARQIIELTTSDTDDAVARVMTLDRAALHEVLSRRRDESRRYFDSVAGKWKAIREETHGPGTYLNELLSRIGDKDVLLELGCGSGSLLEKLPSRSGVAIGVDSSTAMLDEARHALQGAPSQFDLRLGYLEHLPTGDASVDVAVAHMVFHHVAEPKKALMEAARALKSGGRLLIVDLSQSKDTVMHERFGDLWHSFSPQEFKAWVLQSGFCSAEMRTLGNGDAFFLEAKKV